MTLEKNLLLFTLRITQLRNDLSLSEGDNFQQFLKILSGKANSVDPDQTAPSGAI